MGISRKVAAAVLTITAAVSVAVAGVGTPASAASTGCNTGSKLTWNKKWCKTGTIKPNKQHDLRVYGHQCKGTKWRVWDVGTGKTVASGTSKGSDRTLDKVINGLYGTYKAEIPSGCTNDSISLYDF
ncbi:hypothetical protein [Actinoplanes sp. NPDC051494]|uniref:hypothetical protein n=1 Tax=Actinoplanes sp. NPDC051494 TaxID=3363907 RepID=UPI0037A37B76